MEMGDSFMEIIYIDSEDLARHTNLRRAGETDAETWAEFQSYRLYTVDIKQAKFLIDYHNRNGDLADTIPLDVDGFRAITHQFPKTDAAYRKIDGDFWRDVMKDLDETRAAA